VSCCTLSVGVCVLLYTVYVYVLYNVMGQAGMGMTGLLLLVFRVEVV